MKKKLFKTITAILLVSILSFSISTTAFAYSKNETIALSEYTIQDIKALQPYILVQNNRFIFDKEAALQNQVPNKLIQGQIDYLNELNHMADKQEIIINNDLSIKNGMAAPRSVTTYWCTAWGCSGGTNATDAERHWWGVSRLSCDCATRELAADLSSAGSIGSATTILGIFLPIAGIPGAVFGGAVSLFASRLTANNQGHGVYSELTYLYIFDITPQA